MEKKGKTISQLVEKAKTNATIQQRILMEEGMEDAVDLFIKRGYVFAPEIQPLFFEKAFVRQIQEYVKFKHPSTFAALKVLFSREGIELNGQYRLEEVEENNLWEWCNVRSNYRKHNLFRFYVVSCCDWHPQGLNQTTLHLMMKSAARNRALWDSIVRFVVEQGQPFSADEAVYLVKKAPIDIVELFVNSQEDTLEYSVILELKKRDPALFVDLFGSFEGDCCIGYDDDF